MSGFVVPFMFVVIILPILFDRRLATSPHLFVKACLVLIAVFFTAYFGIPMYDAPDWVESPWVKGIFLNFLIQSAIAVMVFGSMEYERRHLENKTSAFPALKVAVGLSLLETILLVGHFAVFAAYRPV